MKNKAEWVTKTAIMIALLVALQFITKGLGQFVTGSCVNFILALTALLFGISNAITVALLSPIFAFIFGIGPGLIFIVPGIMASNLTLVVVLWLITKKLNIKIHNVLKSIIAIVIAVIVKFATQYLVIGIIILPILALGEKQAAAISALFSWPQLVTASIGCTLATLITPRLKRALKRQ